MKHFTSALFLVASFGLFGQNCTQPFISEYLEGSSNNKALEIVNPSSSPLNMSIYSISSFNNGNTSPTNTFQFPNITLPANGVYVIANGNADPSILSVSDTTSGVTWFNGDDAIVLFKNTDTLDIIGVVGTDPGTSWVVGSGATKEFTLVRKTTVQTGQTNWAIGAGEWDVSPQNPFPSLGSHSSACGGSGGGGGGGGPTYYPARSISQIRGINGSGVADSLGSKAAISGVVFTPDFFGSTGYQIHIDDGTGGIMIYSTNDVDSYASTQGDSIHVFGEVAQYNGLLEFVPDSIYLIAQGATQPTATTVTALNENTESQLITLQCVTLVDPNQWTQSGSGFNVELTDGTNNYWMRIDDVCDWYAYAAPTGYQNVTGVGGQYDPSSPYDSGYQIFPRDLADIVACTIGLEEPTDRVLEAYPNPASSILTIQLPQGSLTTIQLINALGQVVARTESLKDQVTMNVEGLNSGLYIVRLTTGDDQRSMRVVIQH